VLEDAFRWRGRTCSTLSEVVAAITGTSGNGFTFFGLTLPWPERAARLRGRRINRSTLIDLPTATEF
jgi:hypothetical protein